LQFAAFNYCIFLGTKKAMRRIILTLIIADKKETNTAENVKDEVLSLLPKESKCVLFEKYEKISGCYKAVFEIYIETSDTEPEFNYKLLTLSSTIARPWMIWFQDNYGTELIFNKTEATSSNRPSLNTIIWGQVQVSSR
jgi:hypothetical protein